ncbi:MAG TPA: enoyl-CoA hydratase-related protein [Streptosporangiaceae bacterium]|jgi:enoyl-CoA hydratase/carnithine racemase
MTGGQVRYEVRGHVAEVVIDDPAKRNALSAPVVAGLHAALDRAAADAAVRVVTLTAVGHVFCAGADLKDEPRNAGDSDVRALRATKLFGALLDCPKPLVARVNGHARAAGVGLVGACDIAIATEEATFAINEVRVGLLPATVAVPLATRMAPSAMRRYALTGETFTAADAVRAGLLDDAVAAAGLDAAVAAVTDHFGACEPDVLQRVKPFFAAVARTTREQAADLALAESQRAFASPTAAEGRRAFRERRPPAWST